MKQIGLTLIVFSSSQWHTWHTQQQNQTRPRYCWSLAAKVKNVANGLALRWTNTPSLTWCYVTAASKLTSRAPQECGTLAFW